MTYFIALGRERKPTPKRTLIPPPPTKPISVAPPPPKKKSVPIITREKTANQRPKKSNAYYEMETENLNVSSCNYPRFTPATRSTDFMSPLVVCVCVVNIITNACMV